MSVHFSYICSKKGGGVSKIRFSTSTHQLKTNYYRLPGSTILFTVYGLDKQLPTKSSSSTLVNRYAQDKISRPNFSWNESIMSRTKNNTSSKSFFIVVIGASGDVAKKKIYPALFELYSKKCLEASSYVQIYGFARSKLTPNQFQNQIRYDLDHFEWLFLMYLFTF